MQTLSRPEAIKRLTTRADIIASMLATLELLPAADQVARLETCTSMADDLSSELSSLTKGEMQ